MSMQKLVDSLTSKPKDQRDAYTITEMKLARKVYKKRIKSWGRFFDKVIINLLPFVLLHQNKFWP